MVIKKVAPYGDWQSSISLDTVAAKNRSLVGPRVCRRTGRAYYTETTDTGRNTIVEITKDGLNDLLPSEYSAHNSVYEYGAGLLDVLPDGRVIFSNEDNTVHILDPDTRRVTLLVKTPPLRYSSFHANSKTSWVLAIEEDHTNNTPYTIRNYLVAINFVTGEVKRIAKGADFYYLPQSNADGTELVWLEWDHPRLLFDACKLYRADWNLDGTISNVRFVTGANGESTSEPRWGFDGSLFYAQEVDGFRQFFRIPPGSHTPARIKVKGLEKSELGEVLLFEGSRTWTPMTERYLVANSTLNGVSRLVLIDLKDNSWRQIADETAISNIKWDAVARLDDSHVLVVANGTILPQSLHKVNIHNPKLNKVVRRSNDGEFPLSLFSKPEPVSIETKGSPSRVIHGFLWMPRNPKFTAPEGALPPLIINAHGGPTGHTGNGLVLRSQYFTSRGYAYFAVNYIGSTGHGKKYREDLFGNWGVIDAADAAEFADHFVESGRVKRGAVGITGISAGGYNTLQCLTRHPKTFAAGVCASGISDLRRFDDTTHKLESDYTPALVLPGKVSDDKKEEIYRERSALFHVDKIESPLLLIHGTIDSVVPVEQARLIADMLKENGRDVKIVEYMDGHMLALPVSAKGWAEEEEKWWRKTLL